MKDKDKGLISTAKKQETAILAGVCFDKTEDIELSLLELKSLANANDIEVLGQVFQNREKPDPKFYIGKGKIEDLKGLIEQIKPTMLIFDNSLSGSKIRVLEEELSVKVIDRGMLILDIFAQRATTREGKLQVELARLKYTLPRLNAIKEISDNFGGSGGLNSRGSRGPGESKKELNKREIEKRVLEKERELKKVEEERYLRKKQSYQSRKKKVALVGYTNAGKSTLMNRISKAGVLEKDMLFATLETTTRNVWLGVGKEILLTDTVGFVNKLPHEFVKAFSSTLEESVQADLILHVVDISNPLYKEQMRIALKVLNELGLKDTPIITVYNKVDKAEIKERLQSDDIVYVSAITKEGIEELKQNIISRI